MADIHTAGSAIIRLLPSALGFGAEAQKAIKTEMAPIGRAVGTDLGKNIGTNTAQGFGQASREFEAEGGKWAQRAGVLGDRIGTAVGRPIGLALRPLAPVFDNLQGRMEKVGYAVGTVGRLGSEAGDKIVSGFKRIGDSVENDVNLPIGRTTGALKQMLGFAATATAAGGIGSLIGMGVERLSQIETARVSITTMTQDAQFARKYLDDLLTFAQGTPFSFPAFTKISQQLLAFGFNAKDLIPTLTAIGDAAAGTGRGELGLNQVAQGLGKIQSEGKVTGRIILNLSQDGVPALAILANKAGVSSEEMAKRIHAGAVKSDFAIKALVTGIEEGTDGIAGHTARLGGLMEAMKDTWVGSVDRFKASITSTMANLLEPVIPKVREAMTWIGQTFKLLPGLLSDVKASMDSSGVTDAIMGIFNDFKDLAIAIWPAIQQFFLGFGEVIGIAVLALRPLVDLLGSLGRWLQDNVPWVQTFGVALGAAAGAFVVITAATRAWAIALYLVGGALDFIAANPVVAIIAGIVALVAAVIYAWQNFETFRNIVISTWNAIYNAIQVVWDVILNVWNAIFLAVQFVWDIIQNVFNAIVTAVHWVADAFTWLWQTILQPVFNFIATAVRWLAAIMFTIWFGPFLLIINLIGQIFSWLWEVAIGPAVRAIGAAMVWLWQNVMQPVWNFIWNAIQFAWDIIQNVFTAIMVAVHWVGDAFVWLWQHVGPVWDFIYNAIQTAWDVIQNVFTAIGTAIGWLVTAFTWLWDNIVQPVLNVVIPIIKWVAIVFAAIFFGPLALAIYGTAKLLIWLWTAIVWPIIQFIGQAFVWLWETILKPTWDAFYNTIQFVWDIVQNVFNAIVTAVHWLGDAFSWFYTNIIQPVWTAISLAIQWAWNNIIMPIWEAIKFDIQLLGVAFNWLWQNIIQPVWNAISTAIQWAWQNVILPVWQAIQFWIGVIATAFTWLWQNIIQPVWNAIYTAIQWAWDNVLKPVFDVFKTVIEGIGTAFGVAKDAIATAWGQVKEIVRAPIQFVIDVVYNKGIRVVWNWVHGIFGVGSELSEYTLPAFAGGGVLPGYSPGQDSVAAMLSPGEGILVPEAVRMLGADTVHAINNAAMGGRGRSGSHASSGHFDEGGVLGDIGNVLAGVGSFFMDLFTKGPKVAVEDVFKAVTDTVQHIPGMNSVFVQSFAQLPFKVIDGVIKFAEDFIKNIMSGVSDWWSGDRASNLASAGGYDLGGALAFARAQAGKPYIWGGVGPAGYDCSGFQSAITNVIYGHLPPYSRLFSTGSFWGGGGAGGLVPGWGPLYSIGVINDAGGGIGHTAGTLMGVNVESRGGDGVVIGGSARGARDGLFNMVFTLPGAVNIGAGSGMVRTFDQGGWLPPGLSVAYNGTGRPEVVMSHDSYQQLRESGGAGVVQHIYPRERQDEVAIGREVVRQLTFAGRLA